MKKGKENGEIVVHQLGERAFGVDLVIENIYED